MTRQAADTTSAGVAIPRPRTRLRWWALGVAALAVAAGIGLAGRRRGVDSGWSRIEATIRAKDWAGAEGRLVDWLRDRPDDGAAWLKLGAVRRLRGRDAEALEAFRRVPEADPARGPAAVQVGELAMKRRDLAGAERAFRAASARLPRDSESRRRLVYLLSIQQRDDEARGFLWELYRLTRDPRQLVTLVGLSDSAGMEHPDLERELDEFLAAAPDDPRLRRAKGLMLMRLGKPAEARPHLEAAAGALEDDPTGRLALAECLGALGDSAASAAALGPLPPEPRAQARWWLLRGNLDEAAGRADDAVACWRKAIAADPGRRAAHYRLGQALIRRGEADAARPFLEQTEALLIRERVLIRLMDQVIQGGSAAELFARLGALCRESGLIAEARAWFEEAIRLDPTRPEAQAALARLVVPDEPPAAPPRLRAGGTKAVAALAPVASGARGPRFEDVAHRAGIDFQYDSGASGNLFLGDTMGGGVGLIDFDGDGWLDVYLVNGCALPIDPRDPPAPNRLYRNRRDGTFEDVTARAGVGGRGYGMGCTVGDYDNDGHDDLFVTGLGATVLYRNKGDGTFEDVTARAGVGSDRWTTAAGFGDLDGDGDLDLVAVTYVKVDPAHVPECLDPLGKPMHCPPDRFPPEFDHLFRNNGDGTFTDVSREAGLEVPDGLGLGLAIADLDDDGRLDLFVANDAAPNFLFRNLGDLRFEEVGASAGVAFDGIGRATASMGVIADDLDADGRLDLFHTNFINEPNTLLKNLGGGQFLDTTAPSGLDAPSRPMTGFGTAALDVDNDGRPDIFVANGHVDDRPWAGHPMAQRPQLYMARGDGLYDEAPSDRTPYLARPAVGRGAAAGDLDNDGRVDLVVVHRDVPVVLLRNTTEGGHWIGLRLVGSKSGRTPVGARVTCRAGGRTQVHWLTSGTSYLASSDPRIWFGLGPAARVDRLTIRWPSGLEQSWSDLPADRILELREGADPVPTP